MGRSAILQRGSKKTAFPGTSDQNPLAFQIPGVLQLVISILCMFGMFGETVDSFFGGSLIPGLQVLTCDPPRPTAIFHITTSPLTQRHLVTGKGTSIVAHARAWGDGPGLIEAFTQGDGSDCYLREHTKRGNTINIQKSDVLRVPRSMTETGEPLNIQKKYPQKSPSKG